MSLSLPAQRPSHTLPMVGSLITLENLQAKHAPSLWKQLDLATHPEIFHYLPLPLPSTQEELWAMLEAPHKSGDLIVYAIVGNAKHLNPTTQAGDVPREDVLGVIAYLNVHPQHREIEIGAVIFGPALQRTAASTEAQFLMLQHIFETSESTEYLPYRRAVWKCNSLNISSRRAAERLGYTYEGTFRKHMLVKGASRDSDWLSILDDEWPLVKSAFVNWLAADNFTGEGQQIRSLESFRS